MLLDLQKNVLFTKTMFFLNHEQKVDKNSHRRSEAKIAKTSLTGTKPTYDQIKKKLVSIGINKNMTNNLGEKKNRTVGVKRQRRSGINILNTTSIVPMETLPSAKTIPLYIVHNHCTHGNRCLSPPPLQRSRA